MIGIISRTEGKGSGAEIVLCHLLNNWNKKYPLLVITALGSSVAHAAKANRMEVIELSFISDRIWPNTKLVEKQLKHLKKVRLMHAWNSKSFELAWYISKRLGIKLTCTMHDHPRAFYYTAKKLWRLRMIANASECMIAVSNKLKTACTVNKYTTEILVIQNGLPDSMAEKKIQQSQKFKIGFLGMNSHLKGFEIIADWINRTKDNELIEWQLYGNICKEYEPMVQNLTDNRFCNFRIMGQQDPQIIFTQIDLLVSASVFFDCFPTVLLEACRVGVPAIASSNGGADEIIEHGQTGFIFDTSTPEAGLQYLQTLADNKNTWMAFSQASRKRFEANFKIEKMVSKYCALWEKNVTSQN